MYVKKILRWLPGSGGSEYQPIYDRAKESYTILEAAYHLEMSKNILYRLIRQGKIHVQRGDDGLIRVPGTELPKVAACRLEKVQRKERCRKLQDQQGKSYEAARKAVYRMKGRIPRIGG
jgi:hypothetical protein